MFLRFNLLYTVIGSCGGLVVEHAGCKVTDGGFSPTLLCFPRTTCTRAIFAHDKTSGPCRRLDDVLYSCTMGLIFLFTFIDVGSTAPKTQALLYNVFRLVEEAVLLTLWFVWIQGMEWYHWLPLTLVPVLFCLNLLFDGLFTASTRPVKCIAVECAPKSL
ncbi:hypothetical protein SK128_017045 [Halocaridina rubra]|uniref:XK-related protein n=1 Tax=Halocaridina rubra TaxID=373956 RepID=A0AAN9A8N9_HALRR